MSEISPATPSEVSSLDDLARAVDESARDQRQLARKIRQFRDGRLKGRTWHEILAREPKPEALHLVAGILRRVSPVSAGLRRLLARGLRAEGATMPQIGERFGVSHQRVSTLLRRGED
jgi:hypothetical protein